MVWVGAGALGRSSGKVALYFREDAEAIERGEPNVLPDTPASKRRTYVLREIEMAALDEAIETLRALLGIRAPGPNGGDR